MVTRQRIGWIIFFIGLLLSGISVALAIISIIAINNHWGYGESIGVVFTLFFIVTVVIPLGVSAIAVGWLINHPQWGKTIRKIIGWCLFIPAVCVLGILVIGIIGSALSGSSFSFFPSFVSFIVISVPFVIIVVAGWWLIHLKNERTSIEETSV